LLAAATRTPIGGPYRTRTFPRPGYPPNRSSFATSSA
jgi:hypothetical protein